MEAIGMIEYLFSIGAWFSPGGLAVFMVGLGIFMICIGISRYFSTLNTRNVTLKGKNTGN